jgi:hypothetical protein
MNSESNTVINSKGEIVYFGLEHFINDIAKGNSCFICGAKPESKQFNDEHIIPDWILRKYNLHDKTITLPNGQTIKYGQYKVPCCLDCNLELGKIYEKPLSILFSKNYNEIVDEIRQNPKIVQLIFKWLSIIFLKTHLKDKSLLYERDRRIDSGYLADNYYWEDIHHIHCVARSHYSKAKLDSNVYGTVLIFPNIVNDEFGGFDYIDSHSGKGVMLQLSEFSIIAVLNDSCAGYTFFKERLEKIDGSLSPFQLREIVAHMNFINLHLKERPIFYSSIKANGEYNIKADLPKILQLVEEEERIVTAGKFLRYYVEHMIGDIENKEQILNEIESGKRNYLFNEKGEFIKH